MADEEFTVALKVTGEDKAARAFENLKLKQMEAGAEATKLAAELRKLQQSGTASAEEIEKTSRALIRAKQSASEYGAQATRVQRAIATSTQSVTAQTTALNAQSARLPGMGQRWSQLGGAMSSLSPVMSGLSPQLGSLTGLIGSVGTSAGSLTTAMGPLGIAIGVVTTAIGVASVAYEYFTDDADDLAEAQTGAAEATESLIDALRRVRSAREIQSGEASSEDIEAAVQDARDTRDVIAQTLADSRAELRRRQDAARNTAGASSGAMARAGVEITEQRAQVDSLVRSLAAAEEGYQRIVAAQTTAVQRELVEGAIDDRATTDEETENAPQRTRRAADRGVSAIERMKAAENEAALFREGLIEDRVNHMADAYAAEVRIANDANDAIFNNALTAQEQLRTKREEAREQEKADLVAVAAKRQELADEEKAALIQKAEDVKRHQQEIGAITSGMWDSIGGTVKDAAGDMFKFLISGAEGGTDAFLNLLDSFLEATSIEYTIKALGEGANAVAAFARQDHAAGAQHLVAAGMAAAVAAATGLASAAISVPSAGGGGEPAQVGAGAGGAGQGGPTNVTIQLYAPQAVFTEAERAEIITSGIREAERIRPGSARI